MEVSFDDESLARLELDPSFTGGFSQSIVKAFRRRMQQIRAAPDERDFYALRSLHFEKLQGRRADQHSMRLNDQYRLILTFYGRGQNKVCRILEIDDYH